MSNPRPSRIVSFLPSATEIACALGLYDSLVGITHECDYPPEVKTKPVVVRNVLPIEQMDQGEIDRAVAERMRAGLSLYEIDEQLLRELSPDLILTQDLCQVCAPSGNEVSQVLKALPKTPEILWMTPRSVEEIFGNIRDLGAATGRLDEANELVARCTTRLEALAARTAKASHTANAASHTAKAASRPRVFCMEWLDPVYASGHWVPELVNFAGGVDEVGRCGGESVRVSWDDVAAWAPEVLVIMPCGFNLQQTMKQIWSVFGPYGSHAANPHFFNLPAVKNGRVYAVDANSYFARPGPRVVEGAELLAQLIHPELSEPAPPPDSHRVDIDLLRGVVKEGKDYTTEDGRVVFTSSYLQRRGYCCNSGCRNCPY